MIHQKRFIVCLVLSLSLNLSVLKTFLCRKMEAGHYRTQTNQIVKTTNPEPNVTTTVATIRPEDIEIVSEAATNTVAGTVAVRTF